MKSKLQIPAAILFLLVSLAAAPAQPSAPVINPATGLPAPGGMPILDPTTGLPVPPPVPQWIDPNWPDPGIILTNVNYDDLPLSEVVKQLCEKFKNQFDVLPMPASDTDWGGVPMRLQLHNVKASEIFTAMNLVFENNRQPVRWELKFVGNRPVAQLRLLPEANLQSETHRMVYFVGNLLGDEKSGGMTMEQIVKTISEVWPADFGKPDGVIQFHLEAQLLVVNGTREQIEFVHQTLAALELKAQLEKNKRIEADLKSRMLPPPQKIMPDGDAKQ